MKCKGCNISAAPYELRDEKCLDCLFKELNSYKAFKSCLMRYTSADGTTLAVMPWELYEEVTKELQRL